MILRLTTQGVPDITTFTEGEGLSVCVCVFVFRQVSAHMHEYAASSYVYWSCGDIPLLLFSVCLFVCVSDSFAIVILFPADFRGEARYFHFLPPRQHYMDRVCVNTHSAENWSM